MPPIQAITAICYSAGSGATCRKCSETSSKHCKALAISHGNHSGKLWLTAVLLLFQYSQSTLFAVFSRNWHMLLKPNCFQLHHRDGRQAQVEQNQQATDRRLLASALAARTNKIKGTIDSIKGRLRNPEPGTEFVQSLAAALDAGEHQITDLKQEQRHKYDELTKEASSCLLACAQQIVKHCLPMQQCQQQIQH